MRNKIVHGCLEIWNFYIYVQHDISQVSASNTRREIPHLHAPTYYSVSICFCCHCLLTFSSTRSCLSQSSLYHCNAQQSEFRFMYQVTLAKRLGQPNAQYRNRQVVFPPMFMWVLCCMQAINDALNGRRMWIFNDKFHQAPALGHVFNALHTAICRTNNQTTLNPAFITKRSRCCFWRLSSSQLYSIPQVPTLTISGHCHIVQSFLNPLYVWPIFRTVLHSQLPLQGNPRKSSREKDQM